MSDFLITNNKKFFINQNISLIPIYNKISMINIPRRNSILYFFRKKKHNNNIQSIKNIQKIFNLIGNQQKIQTI